MPFPDGIVDAVDPGRLRLLVEVGRRGSISAAAEACRIGQPSATKHLQTLGAAVGAKLLERHGRASRLTEAGEGVARRDVSLGLAGELELPQGVTAEPFLDDELVGIAAPGALRLRRGRVAAAQLADRTLLVRERGSSTRAVAERYLARAGYRPAKRWELDSNEAIKRSVAAGLGIGFLSKLVVADELARGELVSFRVEGAELMRRAVYLLRPDGREPTPSERAFIETLSSCCAASVAGCAAEPGAA